MRLNVKSQCEKKTESVSSRKLNGAPFTLSDLQICGMQMYSAKVTRWPAPYTYITGRKRGRGWALVANRYRRQSGSQADNDDHNNHWPVRHDYEEATSKRTLRIRYGLRAIAGDSSFDSCGQTDTHTHTDADERRECSITSSNRRALIRAHTSTEGVY